MIVDNAAEKQRDIYNLIATLSDYSDMSSKELLKIKQEFTGRNSGATVTKLGSRSYYILYESADFDDWMFVGLVPTDIVNSSMNNLQSSTLVLVAGISLSLAPLMIGFILWQNRQKLKSKDTQILYRDELFSTLSVNVDDMLMSSEWRTAEFIKECVISEHPRTVEQLTGYLKKIQNIYMAGENTLMLIAIDDNGRYYSASGKKGVIYNIEELVDCEERISSVTNIFGTDATDILFLYKLDEPISLGDTTVLYCGFIKDFSIVIDRYHTDAFGGQSIVYVMNDSGTKLYAADSEHQNQVFVGRNIYSILEDMTYTHGNSYASCMQTLEETGNSIANASLNGTEYFLCLHRMVDTDWVLLLAIPAQYVATNTQILVDSVVKTLVFAGFAIVVIFVVILVIFMRMQQQEKLYRKEQENSAKLEKSRLEAEASRHAAEEAFQAAEAANNSKSAFLSNMSHDIRTPMNAIVGFSDLLQRDADDPLKVREYTKKIKSSGQHLLGLINDVLDMSKIESGKTNLNLSDERIADVIDGAETIIRPQMQAKSHTFEVVTHDIRHESIVEDKLRLNQILLNLLSNACKYTPDGGRIVLCVTELPHRRPQYANYRFTVSDNGYGMTEEFAATIFDTFTREENSVINKVQGTGLGMAITKSLVKLMGGQISVQTKKGDGSAFTVDLELQLSDATDNAAFWEQNNIAKILVVDDSAQVCRDIALSMKKYGVQVVYALSGEKAIGIVRDDREHRTGTCLRDTAPQRQVPCRHPWCSRYSRR